MALGPAAASRLLPCRASKAAPKASHGTTRPLLRPHERCRTLHPSHFPSSPSTPSHPTASSLVVVAAALPNVDWTKPPQFAHSHFEKQKKMPVVARKALLALALTAATGCVMVDAWIVGVPASKKASSSFTRLAATTIEAPKTTLEGVGAEGVVRYVGFLLLNLSFSLYLYPNPCMSFIYSAPTYSSHPPTHPPTPQTGRERTQQAHQGPLQPRFCPPLDLRGGLPQEHQGKSISISFSGWVGG